jgi:hypothetical protein
MHVAIPPRMEDFMETKRTTGIRVDYNRTAGTITWTANDGLADAIVINVRELADAIRDDGLFHGIDQKVTDSGAMGFGNWDGEEKPKRYAATAERMARMRRTAENLIAGQWNVRASRDPLAGKSAGELEQLIAAARAKLTAIGVGG